MSDCKAPPGRAASAPRKAERNESIIDKHVAVGAFVFDFFGPPERSERGRGELRHNGTLVQVFKAHFGAVMPQFRNSVPPKRSFG